MSLPQYALWVLLCFKPFFFRRNLRFHSLDHLGEFDFALPPPFGVGVEFHSFAAGQSRFDSLYSIRRGSALAEPYRAVGTRFYWSSTSYNIRIAVAVVICHINTEFSICPVRKNFLGVFPCLLWSRF